MTGEVSEEYSVTKPAASLSSILLPSFFPRVSLAVPFWSRATYREMLHAIGSGSVVDGAALGKLQAAIADAVKVENVLLCGSGSFALELALRACDVRRGDEVVIPTFCCSAVVPPVLAVGATPVLADVGDDLNLTVEAVDAALTRKTKVVIVPHLFGNPADIKPIVELAQSKNIRVIDDAAQSLGATIDGKAVGSFGDAGILSFGSEKICSGIGGGALVSRDKELLPGNSGFNLTSPGYLPTVRRCFSTLIWHRWRHWSAPLARIRSRGANPDRAPDPYQRRSMSNLSAAVAMTLIDTLSENIGARRARVHAYQSLLGGDERLQLIPHRPGSACLTQVARILPKGRGRDMASELVNALAAEGYEVQGSYVPIHLLGSFAGCVWDRLPRAERIWADLIELPCEPSVDFDDIEQIAAIVRRVIAE